MREMLAGTFLLRSTLLGELSTPGHTTGVGEGALRPQEEGLCHGQVLTPWQTLFVWALGRNKYHLAGWALRIFYIINKGLQGLRFSLSLNRMISHIIFTMAFSCF